MKISLTHFLRNGDFGHFRIGSTAGEVVALLGEPPLANHRHDDLSHPANVTYRYGSVEFFFEPVAHSPEYMCSMIFLESDPNIGGRIVFPVNATVSDWALSGYASVHECEEHLHAEGLKFTVKCHDPLEYVVQPSHVHLTFTESRQLYSLAVMKR